MNAPLRKRDFYQLVEQYDPLIFEIMDYEPNLRFRRPMSYALRARRSYFLVFQHILKHFTLSNLTFLDLGPFQAFLRLLRRFGPPEELQLYGAGLNASSTFVSQMEKTCQATIFEANLGPLNPDLMSRNFPTAIPLGDISINYIFAGEIIEHLTNPSSMLQESFHVLKSGGTINYYDTECDADRECL